MTDALRGWLEGRPESVRRLAAEFPPGAELRGACGHRVGYVLGWTEDDRVIVSAVNPAEDYDGALAAKDYVCAKHLRPGGAS